MALRTGGLSNTKLIDSNALGTIELSTGLFPVFSPMDGRQTHYIQTTGKQLWLLVKKN
jgi:hypothetical protein